MQRSIAGQNVNADTLAKIIGGIFLIVGILGFFPNPLVSWRGLFDVNTVHNVVHLVSGGILLAAPSYNSSGMALRVIGIVYGIITVIGFISTDALSWMAVNGPDNWLHLAISALMIWGGYMLPSEGADRVTTAHM
ncbi:MULTISPECIES: DUF4383 domain-containing protein [Methylocystis]|uniref:Membrane protein n=1 Tax=Methylocystis iwaonis TaxID=2885079 RepID=A0ABM8E8C4_9HYPH|nr:MULTISPECIES: DUF4383 domain-containing protein [Methylocystis]MDJ0448303.1 DUF4383 domain-containing protein [Methylocystis sp. JR02]BDV34135.1 membrane protein [Methylocystis iwaonis]